MQLLKHQHEEAACNRFLNIYNKQSNNKVDFVRLGNPMVNEPDCVCSNETAIELVGVYDNPYQSEKVWSVARNRDVSKQPDYKLLSLDNLQNEIGIKLSKLNGGNYDGFSGKMVLACYLHSPLLQDYEVAQFINSYVSFRSDGYFDRYFYEIWISWQPSGDTNWKIKKLE